jgi:hypothetical protein
MHELVDLGHSVTHAAVGLCRDETRTSEHIGISPEEGWTVANDNERCLVAALTCNVLQHRQARHHRNTDSTSRNSTATHAHLWPHACQPGTLSHWTSQGYPDMHGT